MWAGSTPLADAHECECVCTCSELSVPATTDEGQDIFTIRQLLAAATAPNCASVRLCRERAAWVVVCALKWLIYRYVVDVPSCSVWCDPGPAVNGAG